MQADKSDYTKVSQSYIESIKSASSVTKNAEIFRGARARRVVAWGAATFKEMSLGSLVAAEKIAADSGDTMGHTLRRVEPNAKEPLLDDPQHADSDKVFYESEQVKEVDGFVSHVWSAGRVLKYLALCYFLNMTAAVASAFLVSFGMLGYLCVTQGPFAYGGQMNFLVLRLVYIPIGVFYLVFFFGHTLPFSRGNLLFWVDKLCIHQTRAELKVAGVTALPEFVANSWRMIILWSNTYFDRLWCCAELATCIATRGGAGHIHFQPLWLAPWVLVTILLDNLAVGLWQGYFIAKIGPGSSWSISVGNALAGEGNATSIFLMEVIGITAALATSYLVLVIPNMLSFGVKLENHSLMLDQIANFRLADAKCTVESDRAVVEDHVRQLFDGNQDLGRNPEGGSEQVDSVGRFDFFVQNTVKAAVHDCVGSTGSLPYKQAAVVFVPMVFTSIVNTLGCDGQPCEESAKSQGFKNVYQYFTAQILIWLLALVLIFPTTYPIMLRGLAWVARRKLNVFVKTFADVIVISMSYYIMALFLGSLGASLFNAIVEVDSVVYRSITVACIMMLCVVNWLLFIRA